LMKRYSQGEKFRQKSPANRLSNTFSSIRSLVQRSEVRGLGSGKMIFDEVKISPDVVAMFS
jgi:hypothetical protein